MDSPQLSIGVLGSLNYDVFLKIGRMPQEGETISASDDVQKAFGGKGANQAVAAARTKSRSTIQVAMLGQLGGDNEGEMYLDYLKQNDVDTTNIKILNDQVTGQAYILSNLKNGQNSIIIVGAANQSFKKFESSWYEMIKKVDILILQMEIPQQVNIEAARLAKENGKTVIMDLGGKDEPVDKQILEFVDYISPNETELAKLFGSNFSVSEQPENEISQLLVQYPNMKFLFKQGEKGATLYYNKEGMIKSISTPAYDFKNYENLDLVDTTGAGDAFTGAFACGLLENEDKQTEDQWREAMILGSKSAFLTISRYGAGPAMPKRDEIDKMKW